MPQRARFFLRLAVFFTVAVLAGPLTLPRSAETPKNGNEGKVIEPESVEAHRRSVDAAYRQTRGETGTVDNKVIYGNDDRLDVYSVSDVNLLRLADAACVVVSTSEITDNGDGTYTLAASAWTIQNGLPLCAGEPFAGQL